MAHNVQKFLGELGDDGHAELASAYRPAFLRLFVQFASSTSVTGPVALQIPRRSAIRRRW